MVGMPEQLCDAQQQLLEAMTHGQHTLSNLLRMHTAHTEKHSQQVHCVQECLLPTQAKAS